MAVISHYFSFQGQLYVETIKDRLILFSELAYVLPILGFLYIVTHIYVLHTTSI